MRQKLIDFYLDYVNNYISVDLIAEHNAITVTDANRLINIGRKYHEQNVAGKHPDA